MYSGFKQPAAPNSRLFYTDGFHPETFFMSVTAIPIDKNIFPHPLFAVLPGVCWSISLP